MRNYISANAKYYKLHRIRNIKNHNLRISDIDYLLANEHIKYNNDNYVYGADMEDVVDKLVQQELLQKKAKGINRGVSKNDNKIIETVLALSEEQAKYYLDNNIDLI